MASHNFLSSHQRGLWAEALTTFFLICKGYRIVARRWKTRRGEIDILAYKGKTYVALEVKKRTSIHAAKYAITPRQRQRIEASLRAFIQRQYPSWPIDNFRFDVVCWGRWLWPIHIKGAWRPLS